MKPDPTLLIWAALGLAISVMLFAISWDVRRAYGGEQQLCQLEPRDPSWSYRTKIGGRSDKCWYEGRRMKPRRELYWAETPAIAPEQGPWEMEYRWSDPNGWSHSE